MSSYIDYPRGGSQRGSDGVVCWTDFTHKRLWWLYGPERALAISCGRDPATLADVEAWNRLGRRAAA